MLTFLTPVLKKLSADSKEKIGLAMATPVTANVSDMGTPIGTLLNVLAHTMHGHNSAKGYGKSRNNHGNHRTDIGIYHVDYTWLQQIIIKNTLSIQISPVRSNHSYRAFC